MLIAVVILTEEAVMGFAVRERPGGSQLIGHRISTAILLLIVIRPGVQASK